MLPVLRDSGFHTGIVRFFLLATISCLAGVADSVMSPYFCPLARQHGMGSTMCGLVISARFGTQLVFLLVFGQSMRRFGARKIYMASVAICATFNMLLATTALIKNDQMFTILSFLFVILSVAGDGGIFCSIYLLAGQENLSLKCGKQKKEDSEESGEKKSNASGPAWMETSYACGSMLGPPIGGLIFTLGGFGATVFTTGLCMALVGSLTWPLYFSKSESQSQGEENDETVSNTTVEGKDCENKNSLNDAENIELQLKTERVLTNYEESEAVKLQETNTAKFTYQKAISNATIASCCLIQISSGITSSWYLSSLESHLSLTMSLSTAQVGLVYMCPGLVYMLLTPVFGFLLDKGFKHIPILVLATLANFTGYLLIGPSSFLDFLNPNPSYTIIGLLLQGFGMSATLMTCMNFMLNSTENPEDESTAGIVASLWGCCEMTGGYLGSTFGGLSADTFGFRFGTNIVLCVEATILVLLLLLSLHNCRLDKLRAKQ